VEHAAQDGRPPPVVGDDDLAAAHHVGESFGFLTRLSGWRGQDEAAFGECVLDPPGIADERLVEDGVGPCRAEVVGRAEPGAPPRRQLATLRPRAERAER
jgi:hypothetical protein